MTGVSLASTPEVVAAARRFGVDPGPLEAARRAFSVAYVDYSPFTGPTAAQQAARTKLIEAADRTRDQVAAVLHAIDMLDDPGADAHTRTLVAAMKRLRDTPEED